MKNIVAAGQREAGRVLPGVLVTELAASGSPELSGRVSHDFMGGKGAGLPLFGAVFGGEAVLSNFTPSNKPIQLASATRPFLGAACTGYRPSAGFEIDWSGGNGATSFLGARS